MKRYIVKRWSPLVLAQQLETNEELRRYNAKKGNWLVDNQYGTGKLYSNRRFYENFEIVEDYPDA